MKTIEERISADIETTVRNVTILNGYEHDMTVERRKQVGNTIASNAITIIDGPLSMAENQTLGQDTYVKSYTLRVTLMRNEDSDIAQGDTQSKYAADLIKALQSTYTRGGIALDTKFTAANPLDDAEMAGISLTFEVMFRTSKDDPYDQ